MTKSRRPSLNLFVALITAAALAAACFDGLAWSWHGPLGPHPAIFVTFACLAMVTELRPLRWLRLEEGGQVTASWTFMMALLLVGPPLAAAAIAGLACLLGDLALRKPATKVLFNSAQITLSLSIGGAILGAAGQERAVLSPGSLSPVWLPVFLVTGAAIFAVNNALTCTAMSLHQGLPVLQTLRSAGAANLSTDGVLLSLSPIFVVVAEQSMLFVPLLLVTTWTVYRTAEQALVRRHEANHDSLTQLPNRRLFEEHLRDAVASARRTGDRVGLVLIDLNGFKGINDRLGHDVGDEVLRGVASRMNNVRRSSDLLARVGGDEFALVLAHLDCVATAVRIAERFEVTFSQPFMIEGFPVSVEASFGVAVLPDHAEDRETLMQRADETMYLGKNEGHGVMVYEKKATERGFGRVRLLADVTDALETNEFFLDYQPQVDLVSGRPIGVEALLRWRHRTAGVLYPAEFIGLAEQTELIGAITERVMHQALAQCAAWQLEGRHVRVAVNVSARDMNDVRFPDTVRRLLAETGADPAGIDLEITENTVSRDRSTIHSVLTRLRALGVSLTIDDFGTGYSSMEQLRELPVDRIKIDRSFVQNMGREARDALIVGAIVRLGQALGIETIAEGVESETVAEMLIGLGCTTAQGWLYGRPMAPDKITSLLREASWHRAEDHQLRLQGAR
jgi:diguanylate cyclase (GGDEF)-like protein